MNALLNLKVPPSANKLHHLHTCLPAFAPSPSHHLVWKSWLHCDPSSPTSYHRIYLFLLLSPFQTHPSLSTSAARPPVHPSIRSNMHLVPVIWPDAVLGPGTQREGNHSVCPRGGKTTSSHRVQDDWYTTCTQGVPSWADECPQRGFSKD